MPAEQQPATPKAEKPDPQLELDLEDLFSQAAQTDEGFAGAEIRVWVDNTGNFTTTGRLVAVFPSEVRLLKDNGRYSTVPMRRLSDGDRAYVQQVVAQLGEQDDKSHLVRAVQEGEADVTR